MAPNNGIDELVPVLRVRINGADLPAKAAADLLSATVHQDVDAPGMFVLEFINWDMVQVQVTWADDSLFAEGNEVEILVGYLNNPESVIVGEITGLEPEFRTDETPRLTVRGYDRSHRLLRGQRIRGFVQLKDSDIASQIAREHGLTAEVEDTGVTLDYVLQHNQTDMHFLRARACRIGYEILVERRTLHFRRRQHAASEILTLSRDVDLLEFYPRLSTLGQVGEVAVRGWNPKNKEEVIARAGTGTEAAMGGGTTGPAAAEGAFGQAGAAIVDRPVFSQGEADQMAAGRFTETALGYVTGEGLCIGRTDLRAGAVIRIEGLGRRFSGLYYVTSAEHSYSPTHGYHTGFAVRRTAA